LIWSEDGAVIVLWYADIATDLVVGSYAFKMDISLLDDEFDFIGFNLEL
jgi:hypothetical protein